MIYEKIPFSVVQKIIGKIFDNETNTTEWILTPDSIHKLAEISGIHLKWRPIVNWENCFELNNYEYTEQDFLDIAFAKVKPSNGPTIIVTDECFKDKLAFSVLKFKNIIPFMENVYPGLFNMQFAQPSDFIFIQPAINLITMIHHEGLRTKFHKL